MRDHYRILAVDDSEQDRQLLSMVLSDDYELDCVGSAEEAMIALQDKEKPDLILLDINMPGTNGYDACKEIRESHEYDDIEVMFLSANDHTDEIVHGLDVGAVDYIVKPYDVDFLLKKVHHVVEYSDKKKKLAQQAKEASQLVRTVMSESGSLGSIVNFLRATFTAKNANDLLDATVTTLREFNIEAVVYFATDHIRETASTSGIPSMLEIDLLERLRNYKEPFLEKGGRLFAIQKNIVVLIKNLPADQTKAGTLKDSLMTLLEGANAKLEFLESLSIQSNQKTQRVRDMVATAKQSLDKLYEREESHRKVGVRILQHMLETMEDAFLSKGLTEQQEQELIDIMTSAVDDSLKHMESGAELDNEIKSIIAELAGVAEIIAVDDIVH